MKGSINPGEVRDASASIVKALSGAPRCAPTGDTTIIYNCDIVYQDSSSARGFTVRPPSPTGFPNPPFGYPFGKWVLTIEANILLPLPTTFKLGMAQNCGGLFVTTINNGRFLINNGSWDGIILPPDAHTPAIVFKADHAWRPTDVGLSVNPGPELLVIADVDLNVTGLQTVRIILPEQNEYCTYQFCPYLFSDQFINLAAVNLWSAGVNSLAQFEGWQMQWSTPHGGLYPHNTKVGTVKWTFARFAETPLFKFSVSRPRTVNFTNLSFSNPSLHPTWDWDFGDGSAHATTFNVSHSYATSDKFIAKLTMLDDTGEAHSIDQVVDMTLKANFTFRGSRFTQLGHPIFDAFFTDQSIGAIVFWDWDFGDGSPHGLTQNPEHKYQTQFSSFVCTLTVTDVLGNTASASKTVNT